VRACFFAFLVAFSAAAMLAGCQSASPGRRVASGSVPILGAALVSAAGLSAQEASDAARLYTAKCARCHKFYDPAGYSEGEWRTWMARMSRKARLKPEQQELLSRYLNGFRAKRNAQE